MCLLAAAPQSLLGRMQVSQTQSHPPSLMGALARFRSVRGPLEKKVTQACPFPRVRSALWVLWLTFGTRLRRWSHDRYMIFD